jgi:2-dehydro-3-deoxyglucarate aldolase/4-hydroxy-2-oxoheptanedioate aldolase
MICNHHNPVRAALAAGRTVYGSEISRFPNYDIPRIYAAAGFEFAFIDLEHTVFSLDQVGELIRASRAASIVPIVRVPQGEYVWIARVLDAGAQGIIVPRVNTAAEVRNIVSWSRHPPYGIRGFGCKSDGSWTKAGELIETLKENTLVVVQIERQQAVDNLEEMLSVPGVDVACLGYMDLSVDMGIPDQMEHPRMVAAVQRVIDVAESKGIAAGFISPDRAAVQSWVQRGMRFISHSNDSYLLEEAARSAMRALSPKATATAKG